MSYETADTAAWDRVERLDARSAAYLRARFWRTAARIVLAADAVALIAVGVITLTTPAPTGVESGLWGLTTLFAIAVLLGLGAPAMFALGSANNECRALADPNVPTPYYRPASMGISVVLTVLFGVFGLYAVNTRAANVLLTASGALIGFTVAVSVRPDSLDNPLLMGLYLAGWAAVALIWPFAVLVAVMSVKKQNLLAYLSTGPTVEDAA